MPQDPITQEGGLVFMSVPASQEPRDGGGRWETIRYALDSTPRTLRYCLMVIASPAAFAAIVELIRHMLLGARRAGSYDRVTDQAG